ncbi:YggS family pyridoxal phosphate-dependent enzyme [Sesbania bispinosa]|nr:YggS family pyridoxal phosphate-dependent enzyme [Sesbania bispinosa]
MGAAWELQRRCWPCGGTRGRGWWGGCAGTVVATRGGVPHEVANTVAATVTVAAALPLQGVTSVTAAAGKDGDRGAQRTVVLAQRRKGVACDGESRRRSQPQRREDGSQLATT